ncbi:hypothetical protein R1flu_018754 [Riccia fluitans]|uniref:Uncharacterized protein n=1 Tax=Riccia fluitans TaxID=41844 RepID=A0ABD1ZGQ6_9MARC
MVASPRQQERGEISESCIRLCSEQKRSRMLMLCNESRMATIRSSFSLRSDFHFAAVIVQLIVNDAFAISCC